MVIFAAMSNPSGLKVHSALLLVGLIYGANYSLAKMAMPDLIQPFGFIVIRAVCGTLIFWGLSALSGGEKIQYKRDYLRLFQCAIFGVAINQLAFFKGLSLTSTISASVIMTSNPVIVLVAAYFILREPITRTKLAGVLLGAAGAVLLILRGEITDGQTSLAGDLLILLNATSYGIYLILVKPLMARYDALTIIKWIFLFGMFLVLPFGLEEFNQISWVTMPPRGWISIAAVVIGTTVLAYLLNVWALKFVNPTVVSYYIYLQPLFATLVATVFLGERLDTTIIVFGAMIFLGVFLVSRK